MVPWISNCEEGSLDQVGTVCISFPGANEPDSITHSPFHAFHSANSHSAQPRILEQQSNCDYPIHHSSIRHVQNPSPQVIQASINSICSIPRTVPVENALPTSEYAREIFPTSAETNKAADSIELVYNFAEFQSK